MFVVKELASDCSCSSGYTQRRNFQLGLTSDRGMGGADTNFYNRWPSPSLPPTLQKVSKVPPVLPI
jgi:hypothetical protein